MLRVVVGGFSLWYLARRRRMLARIAETGPELFEPVGIVKLLDRPLDPRVVRATTDAALAANLAFLLGWRHRVSGPAYSGLLLWVLSYRNSWSMIYHTDNTLVLHALILGLSPSSDAVSLDARRAPAATGATAADVLWHVEDGRMVEAGPPARLLAADGPTARMFSGLDAVS